MKKLTFLLSITLLGACVSPPQEYPRAVLPGDYPDPTIVRDGADYYMTHSPFYYAPGFLIWHSRDLENWSPVTRALPRWRGSAYAPDLLKHNGRFYLYYPAAGTNFVSWADRIEGPWSEPVDLRVGNIDPGHAVGEDGRRWLFLSDGMRVQLTDDGTATVGEPEKVYDGWEFPSDWETEGMWLEAPKLFRRGEYHYLVSAQGGTAGPPTSHMIVVARSRSIDGPWENSPHNPLVHTWDASEDWWSKGHGTLIDDVNGNWWVVYHAYANGFHTLGRQTLLEPVGWSEEGWPVPRRDAEPIVAQGSTGGGLELYDRFDGPKLGLQWTFWKEYSPEAVTTGDGSLTLAAKGTSPADARLLLTTATDKSYETEVEVEVGAEGNQAGLLLFYDEKAWAGVTSDGKTFTVWSDGTSKREIPADEGSRFRVKIVNRGNLCTFSVSGDGREWRVLASDVDLSAMHHNTHGGFYALRPALVSIGGGAARFRNFTYTADRSNE